ncbi:MAG: tetratricopeptide repeat protein, partial [Candidatus Scalindua sp.]|nr:tetratricopeptide repeat protein [Candidatus Scalindua sp.]
MKNLLPVKIVFLVLFITGTCFLGGIFFFSQPVFSQTIPPDAKEAFDSGVRALEQGSFERAIKHLARAHRAAPDTPKFLYSLGFAHAQAGHEILAIIFYSAYLAVQPGAPNADGVKHDILTLQNSVEDIVQALFKEAIAVADDLVEEDARAEAWQEIIAALARAGDLDLARKVAFQHPSGAT